MGRLGVVFGATKALQVAALVYGAIFVFLPFHTWNYLVYPAGEIGIVPAAFINWDGQHYLNLAIHGYPHPPTQSTAFFPLLPGLIRLGMLLGLHPIVSGLAVVTLFSGLALVLLQRLLPREEPAPSSLWLLMCFPTAYYLSVLYTEALFLAGFFGLLWALRDPARARWAFLCAALLPLTRGQGLWLALPLAVAWLALLLRPAALPARASLAAASAGYALGAAAYFGFLWREYGYPLAAFDVQSMFVFKNTAGNLLDPVRFVEFLLRPPQHLFYWSNSVFDKAMMALTALTMVVGMRHSRDAFLLAAWATFAVLPALMGEGGSYGRHALLAWACFVVAAGPSLPRSAKWALVLAMFPLQVLLAALFGGNNWVG